MKGLFSLAIELAGCVGAPKFGGIEQYLGVCLAPYNKELGGYVVRYPNKAHSVRAQQVELVSLLIGSQ